MTKVPKNLRHHIFLKKNKLDEILAFIQEFKPEPFVDEKELQGQLKIYLEGNYPKKVEREVYIGSAGKIDFVIDRKYGIEVKPIWDRKTLADLISQIILYKEVLPEVGIVLCKINKPVPDSIIQEFINRYINYGVKTICIFGYIRSKRGRSKGVKVTWE